MAIDDETNEFITKVLVEFNDKILEPRMKNLLEQLNKSHVHTCNRFDDIEKRLESIESRVNMINKNTEIIPDIFTMLKNNGEEIANHAARVNKLDS